MAKKTVGWACGSAPENSTVLVHLNHFEYARNPGLEVVTNGIHNHAKCHTLNNNVNQIARIKATSKPYCQFRSTL
jgi:hypothetical protein